MRILQIRTGHEEEDIIAARNVIANEIGRPSTNVMIIRGDSEGVPMFADRADTRSEPFPYRQVVWVKDSEIIPATKMEEWFGSNGEMCAVVLDFSDNAVELLAADATLYDIELAFLKAQGGSGGK